MSDSSRIRLCERCWRPVATGTVFRVFRHADPAAAQPEVFSYQHVDGDPSCVGVPAADVRQGRAA